MEKSIIRSDFGKNFEISVGKNFEIRFEIIARKNFEIRFWKLRWYPHLLYYWEPINITTTLMKFKEKITCFDRNLCHLQLINLQSAIKKLNLYRVLQQHCKTQLMERDMLSLKKFYCHVSLFTLRNAYET